MLEVRNLSVSYGQHRALENVSVRVDPGEIVVILGANGAGKSTLLRSIGGLCEGNHTGTVEMAGHPVLGLPTNRIVESGIALVPEGRGVFGELTVKENLLLGAYAMRAREDQQVNLERIISLFPKLGERQGQMVRTMSGGEQQMVAIGRAMMSAPSILMLDEPSLGLSPLLCKELFHSLTEVRKSGLGILLVEQNAKQSLAIADRGYLLENAHIVHADSAVNLASDPAVQKAYLGVGTDQPVAPVAKVPDQTLTDPSEIAAAALGSVTGVPGPRPRPTDLTVRRADDLIGESIDNLVQRAAQARSDLVSTNRASASAPGTIARNDRLQGALMEIEQAAANARHGISPVLAAPTPPLVSSPVAPAKNDDLPEIEVYRKPKVDIYRRPDGGKKLQRI